MIAKNTKRIFKFNASGYNLNDKVKLWVKKIKWVEKSIKKVNFKVTGDAKLKYSPFMKIMKCWYDINLRLAAHLSTNALSVHVLGY